MPEILDVHDILALKMSHASTLIMNDRQKPQNFQNKLNTQQRCVNFVNHLDRIRVLATLCPVKSKVRAFICPQHEAHHTPPITNYVRIDISRDLEVLTEEDALQFFNKLIKPDLGDASSITSTNCAHYRGEVKKRGSPIGITHTRFDIETNSALCSQVAKTVRSHYPVDRNPLIMAFPYNLSAHENTFTIFATKSSAKNGAKLEPTELLNRVASLEKMNSILQYAILRTKYSVSVHLDVHSIPSNTETRVKQNG